MLKVKKGFFAKLVDFKLAFKLPLIIVAFAMLTAVATSYQLYKTAEKELVISEKDKLQAIVETRKEEFSRYFSSIGKDLNFNSKNPFVRQSEKEFATAWSLIEGNKERFLKKLYITDNPNPTGHKEKLDYAKDGSLYSRFHKKNHPWFRTFLRDRGYYDIFLFDLKGNLVYTVFKELDYATNLNTGKWKDTDLGKAYRTALNAKEGSQIFFDFKPYAPSHGAAASFISTPIVGDYGKTLGVLAYQMPIDRINDIIQTSEGLGETGEVLLVGEDYLMRNDSRFMSDGEETTILKRKVETEQVRKALAGESGVEIGADYKGDGALVAYAPYSFKGAKYAFIASISTKEAFALLEDLKKETILGLAITSIIILLLGWLISRSISGKIVRLSDSVEKIAEGSNAEIPSKDDNDEIGAIARSLSKINEVGQESLRVRQALDSVTSSVMMADENNVIIYVNPSVVDVLKNAESDIKKDLPNFSVDKLMGTNIDDFHKNPSHQRSLLAGLDSTYKATIKVGGRIFDLVANPVFDPNDNRLGSVVEWNDVTDLRTQENLEKQVEGEIANVVEASSSGDFTQRLETEGREGFLLNLCQGINNIGDVSLQSLGEIKASIQSLSEGDLTNQVHGDYSGLFGEMKDAINETISKLQQITGEISETAMNVGDNAKEISSASADLSHRTESQASTLEETSASMEQITATVQQNTQNANELREFSQSSKQVAENGGDVVKKVVNAMMGISESSSKISDIIGVIDEIAFQTNLLALNAAVEAARAGDAGKGFAVVADEVRTLAGRSATASKEIKELIQNSVEQVKNGEGLASKAGESLDEIVGSFNTLASKVAEIADASQEQATGVQEVNSAVTDMDQATQQNAAMVEQSTASAQSLSDMAQSLNELIGFFKTGNNTGLKSTSNGAQSQVAENSHPQKPKSDSNPVSSNTPSEEGWEEF